MAVRSPHLVIIAGPNGAGKSTSAPELLKGPFQVDEFVNADPIAQGLSGFRPEDMAITAGRIMLKHLRRLASERVDFAFETTLASRSFVRWIREIKKEGYLFSLVFLWLPSFELALYRVAGRVKMGGHDIPSETIKRRYYSGMRNLVNRYIPLADRWVVYDNSVPSIPRAIASGAFSDNVKIQNPQIWNQIVKGDSIEA